MNDLIPGPDDQSPLDLIAAQSNNRTPNYMEQFEATRARYEYIAGQLHKISLQEALDNWLSTLNFHTAKAYRYAFKRLEELQFVIINCTLKQFSMFNHEIVIDSVKNYVPWSEATRQARAAAYVSFTGFLDRQTGGIIQKAIIKKTGINKTFFKVRDKVKTKSLSIRQTKLFMRELEKLDERYALLAKVMLQGGKRTNEVLSLTVKNVNLLQKQITFRQSKTGGTIKVTVINYPSHIMRDLRRHIGDRTGDDLVFVTRTGKKICNNPLILVFVKAGKNARIPFRVTPHVMRVTLVTRLKELRVHDSDIMKITGHSNLKQLEEYDKSEAGHNATLKYSFV